jgi:hypothetical protein
MNNTPLTKQSLFYFLSASLIISKFYYVIGLTPYTDPLAVLVFPLQRFMINSGTYMSWTGYFINVGLFIFAIVVVYLVLSFPHRKVLKNTENYQAGF